MKFIANIQKQLQLTVADYSDRKPKQSSFEVEKEDNLVSVRRKKLEELKFKSNRKKK